LRSALARVIVGSVTLLLRWALLPVSLVVGLAATLRMAGPAAGPDDLAGVIRLPRPVTLAILGLFALATVVFVAGLARRMWTRRRRSEGELELAAEATPMPAWMRTLTQLLSLANLVIIAYLIWRGVIPLTELLTLGQAAIAGLGAAPDQAPPGAPPLVTWTFGVLAVVAALGALAFALWLGFGDRLLDWWRRDADDVPVPAEVEEERPEDPRAEGDPRRAIMRCYASFQRVASRAGIARQPWHTPMEFMREALRHLPAPRDAVPTLTGLFELARFSRRPLGAAERDRALDALDEIAAAATERRGDAAAR
jgi:hypothetical protein